MNKKEKTTLFTENLRENKNNSTTKARGPTTTAHSPSTTPLKSHAANKEEKINSLDNKTKPKKPATPH
jgi:hypothetical protein